MSWGELSAACPECGGDRLERVVEEIHRVARAVGLFGGGGQGVIYDDLSVESSEDEILDADRDGEILRCADCGHEANDPEDFLDNDDEEE